MKRTVHGDYVACISDADLQRRVLSSVIFEAPTRMMNGNEQCNCVYGHDFSMFGMRTLHSPSSCFEHDFNNFSYPPVLAIVGQLLLQMVPIK